MSAYDAWLWRAPITVTNPPAVDNYSVRGAILYGSYSGMQSDFRDVRFATPAGTPLPYYFENVTAGNVAIFWVKIPAGTTSFLMYFGNVSAVSESNSNDVFDFVDEFGGASIDAQKWSSYSGVTVSGGKAALGPNAAFDANGVLVSSATQSRPIVIGAIIESNGNVGWTMGIAFGDGIPLLYNAAAYYVGTFGGRFYIIHDNGSEYLLATNIGVTQAVNTQYHVEMALTATQVLVYVWAVGAERPASATYTYTNAALNAKAIRFGYLEAATVAKVDLVYARKYAATEPTCTLGSQVSNELETSLFEPDSASVSAGARRGVALEVVDPEPFVGRFWINAAASLVDADAAAVTAVRRSGGRLAGIDAEGVAAVPGAWRGGVVGEVDTDFLFYAMPCIDLGAIITIDSDSISASGVRIRSAALADLEQDRLAVHHSRVRVADPIPDVDVGLVLPTWGVRWRGFWAPLVSPDLEMDLDAEVYLFAPEVSLSVNTPEGLPGTEFEFTEDVTGVVTERAYSFGDGTISDEIDPTHVYAENGSYQVTLVVRNKVGEATATLMILVGINENLVISYDVLRASRTGIAHVDEFASLWRTP